MVSQLETQMRARDREMIPRVLVWAMFLLMGVSTALVALATWSERPKVGVYDPAPVAAERVVHLQAQDNGDYLVLENGDVIGSSAEQRAGFIAVIGRVIDRQRQREKADAGAPIKVLRRVDGHVAIFDPQTEMTVELIGYGADNIAAFARIVEDI